jgi:hypothetical protein
VWANTKLGSIQVERKIRFHSTVMSQTVPSVAELAERHARLKSTGMKRELVARSEAVTSTFDLNALKTAASNIMAKECREVFMVDEGAFPTLFSARQWL